MVASSSVMDLLGPRMLSPLFVVVSVEWASHCESLIDSFSPFYEHLGAFAYSRCCPKGGPPLALPWGRVTSH